MKGVLEPIHRVSEPGKPDILKQIYLVLEAVQAFESVYAQHVGDCNCNVLQEKLP